MGVYKDAEQLYDLLGTLFNEVKKDKTIAQKFAESGLVIQFVYTDPEAEIWLDGSSKDPENIRVITGPAPDLTAEVEMSMHADMAHEFWLGNVNLMVALTRKQIVAKGPIPKIMKLLPIIKPAFEIYHSVLKEKGLEHMITSK